MIEVEIIEKKIVEFTDDAEREIVCRMKYNSKTIIDSIKELLDEGTIEYYDAVKSKEIKIKLKKVTK